MNIKKRLELLEGKIQPATQPWKAPIIKVMPGQTAKEQIAKFKAENDVGPDDDFTVIKFVEPEPRRF